MSSEARVDNPGTIYWLGNNRPSAVIVAECPHTSCRHTSTTVVAWGPDLRRYELLRCDDGCKGSCRGWRDATDPSFKHLVTQWMLVEDDA